MIPGSSAFGVAGVRKTQLANSYRSQKPKDNPEIAFGKYTIGR
jgi:hypothetical protein